MSPISGFGFDEQGRRITMSDEQVDARVRTAIHQPDAIILLVLYSVNGEMHVEVNGPPSKDVLEACEHMTANLRKIVRGE